MQDYPFSTHIVLVVVFGQVMGWIYQPFQELAIFKNWPMSI